MLQVILHVGPPKQYVYSSTSSLPTKLWDGVVLACPEDDDDAAAAAAAAGSVRASKSAAHVRGPSIGLSAAAYGAGSVYVRARRRRGGSSTPSTAHSGEGFNFQIEQAIKSAVDSSANDFFSS